MKLVSHANYLGPDAKGRDRGGCSAVLEVTVLHAGAVRRVRLFSISPKDDDEAIVVNAAVDGVLALAQHRGGPT